MYFSNRLVYTVQGTPGKAREGEEGSRYTLYGGLWYKSRRGRKGAGIHCTRGSCTSRGWGGREQVYTVQGTLVKAGEEEEGSRCALYEGLLDNQEGGGREQVYTIRGTLLQAGEGEEGSRYTLYKGLLDKPGRRRKELVYTAQGTPGKAGKKRKGAATNCTMNFWTCRGGGGEQVYIPYGTPG